jgi:hypothetical protein
MSVRTGAWATHMGNSNIHLSCNTKCPGYGYVSKALKVAKKELHVLVILPDYVNITWPYILDCPESTFNFAHYPGMFADKVRYIMEGGCAKKSSLFYGLADIPGAGKEASYKVGKVYNWVS